MNENEGEKKSFKVVDRRRFTEEGDERSGPDVAPAQPPRKDPLPAPPQVAAPQAPPAGTAKPVPGKPAPPQPAAKAAPEAPGTLSFSIFVQSLAQQCLMQLGLMPWPHGQREMQIEQARDTIDILAMLKSKTAGNLSAEEQQLLDTALYELKMGWVEVQQAIARSKGAPRPPPPPGR